MKRLIVVLAGLLWAAVLFVFTLWFTFPGDAVAERVEYQVSTASRGNYALDLGSVGPWWLGLSTDSVKVYTREKRTDPPNKLMMIATDARMAAGLFSLMAREPRVSGSVTLGLDGTLDYVVGTSMDDKGKQLLVTEVKLEGQSFPLGELLALVPGATLDATGKLDLQLDLEAPDGLSKADGIISLNGKGLSLVNPELPVIGPMGRDVQIAELDIKLDADEGRARVDRGTIQSDMANIRITGDIGLADDIGRSNLNLNLEIELDESMQAFASFLKDAEKGGKYYFECRGTLNAIDRACRAAGSNRTATRPGGAVRPRPVAAGAPRPVVPASDGNTDEDREKRRQELQERLKQRREQRRAEREGGGPKRPGEGVDEPVDEDPVDEELPPEDEELPPEEELPLDEGEEEFFEE
ncbi:MAG: type II secretion system protein GspN [Myxococcota bacterium]